MVGVFKPTPEQERIIAHAGSAFISACPGSGKTRVMVERARILLNDEKCRGVAFLSFTNAAVAELEGRLRMQGLLPSRPFPHFIGTFDSFIWQFLIAPFGVPGCDQAPHLIPDKNKLTIRPADKLPALALECFDRATGRMIPEKARQYGYDPNGKDATTKAYEAIAASTRATLMARGELDYDDIREIAKTRLLGADLAQRLSAALSARFSELIVDEAQDCNPADLEIIKWLQDAGLTVKVICDPHQSIYEFRGGVTAQLLAFSKTFAVDDQLPMSGNFRSSDHICKAIVGLRDKDARETVDQALGEYKAEPTPIQVFSYSSKGGVSSAIGTKFQEISTALKFDISHCPVLAKTRSSGCRAVGQPAEATSRDMTLRLAEAIMDFHFSFETGNQRNALEALHGIVLELEGNLKEASYHQHLKSLGMDRFGWRPRILDLARQLRYDPFAYANSDAWLERVREVLSPCLPAGGQTIKQRLKNHADLASMLAPPPVASAPAKTIHSVKGRQFPAVCAVMTAQTAKGILDYLETGEPADSAEDAREIYVAASRAERLLVIAVPKSQSKRLAEPQSDRRRSYSHGHLARSPSEFCPAPCQQ